MRRGPPSLRSSRWRFGLFSLLYLYQGLVAGFALTALANHFAAAGASTAQIGRHLAVVGLPWVLQPLLWGPVIDRGTPSRMGARRFWLVLSLACAQACLAGLLLLGADAGLTAISAVLFLHSLAASLADTATDRLISGTVPADELGRTSAGTRAGFVIGSAAGTAIFAWILAQYGLPAAAGALLALTTPLALAPVIVRETPDDRLFSLRRDAPPRAPGRGRMAEVVLFTRGLLAAFRGRDAAILLAMCFAIDFGLALFQVPFAVALVQVHGWDAGDLSRLQAGLALLGGTLGAGVSAPRWTTWDRTGSCVAFSWPALWRSGGRRADRRRVGGRRRSVHSGAGQRRAGPALRRPAADRAAGEPRGTGVGDAVPGLYGGDEPR
ncbi:MFS transporter [Methylobacterium persicinum]